MEGPQTVFVRAILEGLRGVAFGRSDYLSAQDLASWVQHRVAQETNHQQFPTYERLGFGEGSFIFFKVRAAWILLLFYLSISYSSRPNEMYYELSQRCCQVPPSFEPLIPFAEKPLLGRGAPAPPVVAEPP